MRMLMLIFSHNIAHARAGVDELGRKILIYLLAQKIYIHIDYIGTGVEGDVPDFFGNVCTRNYPSFVTNQVY